MIATVFFLGGLALTLVLSLWVRGQTRALAQARLDSTSGDVAAQVEKRFAAYVGVLAGLRALFHAREVSREDFYRFAEAVAQHNYPASRC